jgi:hypothetical protein
MKSKTVDARVYIEKKSIVDKKNPMFRARYPDQHFVRIMMAVGKSLIVAREFIFDDKVKANEHYDHLRSMLG